MAVLDSSALQASLARPRLRTGSAIARIRASIFATDAVIIAAATLGAQLFRFSDLTASSDLFLGEVGVNYLTVTVGLAAVWLIALSMFRTRDARVLGVGDDEYRRVVLASISVFGVVAIVAYALQLEIARGYLAFALPAGIAALCLSRKIWRTWLAQQRSHGEYLSNVIVVGSPQETSGVVKQINATPKSGLRVVGTVSTPANAAETAKLLNASAVIIAGGLERDSLCARTLTWELEKHAIELIVPSPLSGIDQMRVQHRPAGSMPLMHVEMPKYSGLRRVAKRAFDIAAAALALVLLSPVFAIVAFLVKRHDGGPVFFKQERIGRNGVSFSIYKFRTMVTNAEALKAALLEHNEGAGPLFKMKHDPRITPLGAFLRRSSIDELPQLMNVLLGTMSLVGPRPGLPTEVADYERHTERRLLVSPGITGLSQVTGRSDLTWEQNVRFDLHYVENWSFGLDLAILGRTVKAVTRSSGAY
ncbi:sugar transferase [Leucobacter japonicus]|uniref:sugar transferase n=1 Tax=Leucobacter japonicus TaxID=1461259 RepID=UPI0006A786E3|nr:sugar transferase [Leucobacter japonicus]